jgi:hypothetical protein
MITWKHTYLAGFYFFDIRPDLISFILYRSGFLISVLLFLDQPLESYAITFVAWLAYISIYEAAYIDNDYFAIKREDKPSVRLPADLQIKIVFQFIAIRLLYFIASFVILNYIFGQAVAITIALAVVLIGVIFYIHNRLPRRHRIITYAALKCSHLIIPIIFVGHHFEIIFAVIIFYLPAPMVSYLRKLDWIGNDLHHVNRAIFVGQLSIIAAVFLLSLYVDGFYFFIGLSCYLLLARLAEVLARKTIKRLAK